VGRFASSIFLHPNTPLRGSPALEVLSTPAHLQVTQTVGRLLCLPNLTRASERVLSTREMANAIIVRI
jgi:hypothetical protein